jgi:hypothetical protein
MSHPRCALWKRAVSVAKQSYPYTSGWGLGPPWQVVNRKSAGRQVSGQNYLIVFSEMLPQYFWANLVKATFISATACSGRSRSPDPPALGAPSSIPAHEGASQAPTILRSTANPLRDVGSDRQANALAKRTTIDNGDIWST